MSKKRKSVVTPRKQRILVEKIRLPRLPLAVPKISMRLGAARNFDRCEACVLALSATGSAQHKPLVPHIGSVRKEVAGSKSISAIKKAREQDAPVLFWSE